MKNRITTDKIVERFFGYLTMLVDLYKEDEIFMSG